MCVCVCVCVCCVCVCVFRNTKNSPGNKKNCNIKVFFIIAGEF